MTQPPPAGPHMPPQGYYPPQQPPKKKHTLRNVLLAIAAFIILLVVGCSVLAGKAVKGASDAVSSAQHQKHTIVYTVSTNVPAEVTYGQTAGTSQEKITKSWTKTVTTDGWDAASILVQANPDGSSSDAKAKVACKITVDGVEKSNNSGSGEAATATCDASS